jgi:predicted mannosyl-3-phosphoglycerate phosphatase (HAD superfamily)
MRVIFTDIDGVLNPHWRKKWRTAIILYNKICKEFDLRVVITSTWRTNHTIEQPQQIF